MGGGLEVITPTIMHSWPTRALTWQGYAQTELESACRALPAAEREIAIASLAGLEDLPEYARIKETLEWARTGNGLDPSWNFPEVIRGLDAREESEFYATGGKRIDIKRLADFLAQELGPFALSPNLARIYYYDRAAGIYRDQAEEYILRPAVAAILKGKYKVSIAQDVINYLVADGGGRLRVMPADNLTNSHFIPVANGILDWKTLTLQPFHPRHLITSKLQGEWNPDADCPQFIDAFKTIFQDDLALVDYTFVMLACCIYGGKPSDAAGFFLAGDGRNGKSTLINIFESILDKSQVSHIAPQDFDTNRFAVAELYGKLANFSGDVSATKFNDSGN